MSKERTLTSEMLYDGRIMKLYKDSVELENGKTSVREYIRHSGGASIMAVDKEENVYFVTQYRYPYAAEVFEIPAGKLEKGEEPLTCAIRELEEEAGLRAEKFELIATVYPTPSYTNGSASRRRRIPRRGENTFRESLFDGYGRRNTRRENAGRDLRLRSA